MAEEVIEKIKKKFGARILESHSFRGDETVLIKREGMVELFTFLRDDADLLFNFMMDLTAVDYYGRSPRFEVVYHLYSLRFNRRLRVKIPVEENECEVDSLINLWVGIDWYEREVWDMYGIKFKGHPDLRRILLYKEFEGHPLRKDYPVDKRQPLIGPKN